jgi:hypothetical protein
MLEKTRGTIRNGRYRDTGYQTKNDTQHGRYRDTGYQTKNDTQETNVTKCVVLILNGSNP